MLSPCQQKRCPKWALCYQSMRAPSLLSHGSLLCIRAAIATQPAVFASSSYQTSAVTNRLPYLSPEGSFRLSSIGLSLVANNIKHQQTAFPFFTDQKDLIDDSEESKNSRSAIPHLWLRPVSEWVRLC
ncbi:unnamed protein product [Eretmochelys imbricata]